MAAPGAEGTSTGLRRAARGEAGFSLIELLVVAAVGLLVIGSGVTLLVGVLQGQSESTTRSADIGQARALVDSITRDVRQGYGVTAATSTRLEVLTWVNSATCGGPPASSSIQCKVTYQCSAGTCTRAEGPPGAPAGSGTQMVSGLTPGTVFEYSPDASDPTWIGVRLEFPGAEGDDAITLEDGTALRNTVMGA